MKQSKRFLCALVLTAALVVGLGSSAFAAIYITATFTFVDCFACPDPEPPDWIEVWSGWLVDEDEDGYWDYYILESLLRAYCGYDASCGPHP